MTTPTVYVSMCWGDALEIKIQLESTELLF